MSHIWDSIKGEINKTIPDPSSDKYGVTYVGGHLTGCEVEVVSLDTSCLVISGLQVVRGTVWTESIVAGDCRPRFSASWKTLILYRTLKLCILGGEYCRIQLPFWSIFNNYITVYSLIERKGYSFNKGANPGPLCGLLLHGQTIHFHA